MNLLLLILALLGLAAGTEIAVRQALRLATSLDLSPMFVGLTIVAIGTDLPELVLSIEAAIQRLGGVETSGLVIGNAIGSCLGQIGLALGATGLFGYVMLGKRRAWSEGVMLIGSIALFFLVGLDGEFTRIDGGVLIVVYVIYFTTTIRREQNTGAQRTTEKPAAWIRCGAMCFAGLLVVAFSSHVAIVAAVELAEEWGIQQTFIGIVLLGAGTSLPELAVSINAVRKNAGSLSVGNIFGSNIFDMLVAPGAAAAIAGLTVDSPEVLRVDLLALLGLSALVLYFFRKRKGLQKIEAFTLVVVYGAYILLRTVWAEA